MGLNPAVLRVWGLQVCTGRVAAIVVRGIKPKSLWAPATQKKGRPIRRVSVTARAP